MPVRSNLLSPILIRVSKSVIPESHCLPLSSEGHHPDSSYPESDWSQGSYFPKEILPRFRKVRFKHPSIDLLQVPKPELEQDCESDGWIRPSV